MIQLLFIWDLTSCWGQALPRQVKASKGCHCCSAPDSLLPWMKTQCCLWLNCERAWCGGVTEHFRNVLHCHLPEADIENMHSLSQTKHRKMTCSPVKFRNYKNRTLMVYCKWELIAATCQWRKNKWEIESNHATMISPHRGRDQPHPTFSRASGLQYHNSPSLTVPSCLCIFIFPSLRLPFSPSFWFYAFLSFTAPLWPEPYRCQSPWRRADRHPTLLLRPTERVGEKKKKKNERKEGLCVSVIPFYSSWENANSIDFELKRCFFFFFLVNEKTSLGANGPWKE